MVFPMIYAIILITAMILWSMIEQKLLMVSTYNVQSIQLPKELQHTSFVLLSDLHNRSFGKANQRLINRIRKLAPDFILVAGDIINKRESSYPSHGFTLLEELAKDYMIYYSFGNHEQSLMQIGKEYEGQKSSPEYEIYTTWVEYIERLKKLGIIFLDNTYALYQKNGQSLCITGVSIGKEYFSWDKVTAMDITYLDALIESKPKDNFRILMAHNPDYFTSYAKWGADLTVSGHLHGGMVRLPGIGGLLSPQAKFFPKYHSGCFEDGGKHLIVSRGLGSHSIMPRLFNIPEIVQVVLESKE